MSGFQQKARVRMFVVTTIARVWSVRRPIPNTLLIFERCGWVDVPSKNARIENLGVRLSNFRFGGLPLLVNSESNARQI